MIAGVGVIEGFGVGVDWEVGRNVFVAAGLGVTVGDLIFVKAIEGVAEGEALSLGFRVRFDVGRGLFMGDAERDAIPVSVIR